MRFLVDECTGPKVAVWLRTLGHDVFSVYDEARGMNDDNIIQKVWNENWILITNDKDFGEKITREKKPHHGIILLRLIDERSDNKIATLHRLLDSFSDRLAERYVVVTETQVRFANV